MIRNPENSVLRFGNISASLMWNSSFGSKRTEKFHKTQEFIDSECIRLMKPFTPMKNGVLMGSATRGTVIGSGHIVYTVPYGRYQYYGVVYGPNYPIYVNGILEGFWSPPKKHKTNKQINHNKSRHPKAQRLWFEPMKRQYKGAILRGAAAIAGGRAK